MSRSVFVRFGVLSVILTSGVPGGLYVGTRHKSADGTGGKSTPKAAIDKGHGVECASNLNQLRADLQMRLMEDEHYPSALDANSSLIRCPVSQEPYGYDPRTGRVWGTTPGHETF